MDSTTHLSDYLAILRRRRKQIVRVAAAVFALAVILAVALPPVYRSTAKLLIENEMSPEIVPSTVTGYLTQRVRVIESRILTPERLAAVAERLDLYPEEREAGNQAVASRMRSNISIEPVSANVTDPKSGRSGMVTVAFDVSYDASTPEVAQRVAQELARLFIDENRMIRTEKAQGASGFLREEEVRLREQIADLETKLAAYKSKNQGQLPELMNMNMQMLERSQREIEEAERQIQNLQERQVQLQSQLALVEPHTGDSPGGRLRQVQSEYMAAASRYSAEHPDVVRLKREMDSLKREAGVVDERALAEQQYRQARDELAAARKRYSNDHPDVVKLQKTVANLERKVKATGASGGGSGSGFAMKPDNPAYVTLQTQLDTVALALEAAMKQRERAEQRIAQYESRLVQTPRVEQEGAGLLRDYESAMKKYREIKQSLMSAELAVELERGEKGERYSLLEPAELPGSPERPNRKAFILLGLVLGIGGGIGYASIAEYMDRTVRGSQSMAAVLGAQPLAVIPFIPNGIDPPSRTA